MAIVIINNRLPNHHFRFLYTHTLSQHHCILIWIVSIPSSRPVWSLFAAANNHPRKIIAVSYVGSSGPKRAKNWHFNVAIRRAYVYRRASDSGAFFNADDASFSDSCNDSSPDAIPETNQRCHFLRGPSYADEIHYRQSEQSHRKVWSAIIWSNTRIRHGRHSSDNVNLMERFLDSKWPVQGPV